MKFLFSRFKTVFRVGYSGRTPQPSGGMDTWLFVALVVLSIFGVLMVYDASVAIGIRDFHDQYYFAKEQIKWLLLGYCAFIFFSKLHYHRWYFWALPLLLVVFGLLLMVFIPGFGVRALGAHRWLNFGFFVLQPAEMAKLVLIVYLSAWFSTKEKDRFFAFLLLTGGFFGLVVLEPDLGTGIILAAISFTIYFLSGAPSRHFMFLIPVVIAGVMILAVASPYRFARITTFLNTERDPLGASYQIRQVLLALGSGGWFGVGPGKSRQKYEYLPEANTDSIFAIIGEELGFAGGATVVSLFAFITWRGFRIAQRAPDPFGKLLAGGIASWVGIQASMNLAAMVSLIPLTGIPLPLVSYGGSSLVITMTGLGVLMNISKYVKAT